MRADQLLLQRSIASSRSQAQRLIASGVRWRVAEAVGGLGSASSGAAAWKSIVKNSDELPLDAEFELQDASEAQYVSRGGLKLEGALKASGLQVSGKLCLDVGQSTGGFTDCLLQQGAQRVVGVDVGSGQLHPSLREHPQVVVLENCNARQLSSHALNAALLIADYANPVSTNGLNTPEPLPERPAAAALVPVEVAEPANIQFDLIVGDLSFISQTLVLPALVPLLKPGADLLMLVKPQFELQPGQVGKGGIVKDAALYAIVEHRIRACCADLGLRVVGRFCFAGSRVWGKKRLCISNTTV